MIEREVNYRDWYRYEHAEFMKRPAIPWVNMQFTLDVTHFRSYVKARGISFYLGLIWASTKVMEAREDFRWRLRDDKVVLIKSPEPSFTDLTAGDELFKIVKAGLVGGDMAAYAQRARATADAQKNYFPTDEDEMRDDFIYYSSLPGMTFTMLVQTLDLNKDDFIPRLAWSRFWEEGGRTLLPYTIQCNHRLVDGLHIARFFNELQAYVDGL